MYIVGESYCNVRAAETLVVWFVVVDGDVAMMAMISTWSLAHDSGSYDVGAYVSPKCLTTR
jgi:hypothetical protein